MPTTAPPARWSWAVWLAAADARLSDPSLRRAARAVWVACHNAETNRRRVRPVPYYEVDTILADAGNARAGGAAGAAGRGAVATAGPRETRSTLTLLHAVAAVGLLDYHEPGHFAPRLGPAPPAPGSIRLRPAALALLTELVCKWHGSNLWRITRPGYLTPKGDPTRWQLNGHGWFSDRPAPRTRAVPARLVDQLGRRELLENSHCIAGDWRSPSAYLYRVRFDRLYAIHALPPAVSRAAARLRTGRTAGPPAADDPGAEC